MAYPQDLVGKFIHYGMDVGRSYPEQTLRNMVVNGVVRNRTSAEDIAVYTYSPPQPGVGGAPQRPARWINTNVNWSFVFLYYLAGAVTVAKRDRAILTGPISGCFLFKYSDGGPEHIAHVGTANEPTSKQTLMAKTWWHEVVSQRHVSAISGASPYAVYQWDEILGASLPGTIPMLAGYFTTTGPAYSMVLCPVPTTMNPPVTPMMKVCAVKNMPLTSWNTIRNLPQFSS